MNLETFLEKFDLVADAPEAVANMRELILQLAVRGKLVHQNPKEEDAGSLLESIASARNKNGRHKSDESETVEAIELPEAENWHQVPDSWRWVRLGFIGDIVGGGTPRSENSEYFTDQGIPWLTPADLNGFREKRIFRGRRCITQLGLENSSAQLLPEGSVLFSSRAPIGYVAIAGTQMATNQGFKSCVPFIKETNEFLYYYLKSAAARIDSEAPGTTFREVSGKIVSQVPVPLPPLAEQKRIVAKVDELMALCDRLEAQQQERETRHAALARASLARFADAPTPANLNFIFHKSYDVAPADLRKTILTLAVQGKLVPQEPGDEPAREFMNRITSQRASGTESNGVSIEIPFEVPNTWCWIKLDDRVHSMANGIYKPAKFYSETGTACVRMFNIQDGSLDLTKLKRLDLSPSEVAQYRLEEGDLIVNRVNSRELVGKSAVVPAYEEPLVFEAMNIRVRLVERQQLPYYVNLVLRTDRVRELFQNSSKQAIGQASINQPQVGSVSIPLPPLAEQRRIVAKVNELLAVVDALETQLSTARATAEKLIEAVVAELTA
jgi:type I restriction enzyme S subunit